MLNNLWIIGVKMSKTRIGITAELLECSKALKHRKPKAKVNTANGKVSNNGSLLEVSPSLFKPFLLLKNDPVMSPSNAVNPRKVPTKKATMNSFVEPSKEDSHP